MRYKLGQLIEQYDEINDKGEFQDLESLQGINSLKYFQECKSNKNDIDLYRYRICRKGMFAYNRATSRNGEKISIAYREGDDCLISPSYYCFKIVREDLLLADYLMIWLKRPVFDKYARFHSWGSATEFFTFEDFCDTEINLPSIEKQHKIVHDYKVIVDRVHLLEEQINVLNEFTYSYFEKTINPYYQDNNIICKKYRIDELCDVKGGKRLPSGEEVVEEKTLHPYIRVRDVGKGKYVSVTDDFVYITDEIHEEISRYIVNTNDIVISIVGTIGLIGKIHSSLNGANLTENCMKFINIKNISADYLYYTLEYKKRHNEIELNTVGAVQAKLPMYNINSMLIAIPDDGVLHNLQKLFEATDGIILNYQEEINILNSTMRSLLKEVA